MKILYHYDVENGLYLSKSEVEDHVEVPFGATDIAPDFDIEFDPQTHYARFYISFWKLFERTPEAPEVISPVVSLDMICAQRYAAETSGVIVNDVNIATDDRSKLLIIGAALEAMLDPDYRTRWKTPNGFVELTAQEIIAMARAVRVHVQSCFDREAELQAAVADGSITLEMLEQGWP